MMSGNDMPLILISAVRPTQRQHAIKVVFVCGVNFCENRQCLLEYNVQMCPKCVAPFCMSQRWKIGVFMQFEAQFRVKLSTK